MYAMQSCLVQAKNPVLGVHLTGFRYGSKHSLTETVVRTTARSSPDSDFGA
jgi:7-cyano-7-deazaguanine synthase in queuosine biosynthesis